MLWDRATYRTRQFWQALFPKVDSASLETARSVLNGGEMALFLSMETRDQCHGLRVMQHLVDAGEDERDLLAAALIHDCGKGRVPVLLRTLNVLAPWAVNSMAQKESSNGSTEHGWCDSTSVAIPARPKDRETAYRLLHHAELGAEMAERAGSSAATIAYIRGQVDGPQRAKMSVLRAADDRS